ncbi:MAG: SEC-C metal-binding domain-containing protein [Halieaceae bacterium]|nr:SEC-C metal-binding domain-containing protein [Halieaceae bacterium]
MPASFPSRRPQDSPIRSPKIGRNSLCPCGSGKKFKHCCLH